MAWQLGENSLGAFVPIPFKRYAGNINDIARAEAGNKNRFGLFGCERGEVPTMVVTPQAQKRPPGENFFDGGFLRGVIKVV